MLIGRTFSSLRSEAGSRVGWQCRRRRKRGPLVADQRPPLFVGQSAHVVYQPREIESISVAGVTDSERLARSYRTCVLLL
jgi:hypothetical protein